MSSDNESKIPYHPAIAVHGGAWAIPEHLKEASLKGVQRAVREGHLVLVSGGTAVDAVEAAVRVLEDDPAFDAGTGAVLNHDGEVELDAIVMEGKELKSGAVMCVKNIKNPVSLARMVMEKTDHHILAGEGANRFASEMGIKEVSPAELVTDEARKQWEEYKKFSKNIEVFFSSRQNSEHMGHETVGAVAVDQWGNVACATSTGGITGKKKGRVGDTPIVGSGAYCDNAYGAVSTTGHGEAILRVTLAKTVISYMELLGLSVQEATDKAIDYMSKRVGGAGGVIAVSPDGQLARSFSSERMAWAFATKGSLRYGIEPNEDIQLDVEASGK